MSYAGWKDLLLQKAGLSGATTLNDTRIGEGLKAALRTGIDRAVALTSKKDGYLKNEEIRIPLPDRVQKTEAFLRKIGLGPKLDEWALSMNRAAEQAAPMARDIFVESVASMSFDDVNAVYKGGDTAATDYLKRKASPALMTAYRPAVTRAMAQYGVTQKYQEVLGKVQALPMGKILKMPDLESYVVQKSLDGLFVMMAHEERRIRTDPAARATDLLREVFGAS